jgi:hypothetical protein
VALLTLLSIALAALLLTQLLGFLVLRACTRLNETECWGLAGVTGCAILGHIALAAFLGGRFERGVFLGLAALVAGLAFAVAVWRRIPLRSIRPPRWALAYAGVWLVMVCVHLILPIFSGGYWRGDWWMYFDVTQFYLGLRDVNVVWFETYTIPSRPPLYNLVQAFHLAVFGNSFAVYQVTSLVPGLAFLGCFFLLARSVSVWVCAFLIAFNPFLVTSLIHPWPKMLAGGCLLATLHLYLKLRAKEDAGPPGLMALCAVFAALSLLTHTSTVIYLVAMLADYVWLKRRRILRELPRLAVAGLLGEVVLFPWCFWVARTYGALSLVTASPTLVLPHRFPTTGPAWVWGRLVNAAGSLLPLSLYDVLVAGTRPNVFDAWLRFFYATLPGALTLTLTGFFLTRVIRSRAVPSFPIPASLVALLTVFGFAGTILLAPGNRHDGLVADGMTPLVMILLLPIAGMATALPPPRRRLLLLALLVEYLATRGAHTVLQSLRLLMVDNYNLWLRETYKIVFARVVIGNAWIAAALLAVVTAAVIVVRGLSEPPSENSS